MQENRVLAPAFLQKLILVRIKSQRSINHFRILHGQLKREQEFLQNPGARAPWEGEVMSEGGVIASVSEAIQSFVEVSGLLRRFRSSQ
jgi:hypothetical protein